MKDIRELQKHKKDPIRNATVNKYPRNRKSHVCSDETRKKISEATKGKKKVFTKESYEIWMASRVGKPAWNKGLKGQVAWNKGMKMSDEHRKKLSLSHITTGTTPIMKRLRSSVDYKNWREAVYKRDDYTCRKCLQRGGKLHPHHFASFARYSDLRFEVDNGITLCVDCHKNFHKQYGLKSFKAEHLFLFIDY
jgi:hypothetical protein